MPFRDRRCYESVQSLAFVVRSETTPYPVSCNVDDDKSAYQADSKRRVPGDTRSVSEEYPPPPTYTLARALTIFANVPLSPSGSPAEAQPLAQSTTIGHFNARTRLSETYQTFPGEWSIQQRWHLSLPLAQNRYLGLRSDDAAMPGCRNVPSARRCFKFSLPFVVLSSFNFAADLDGFETA
jgi:hypothetical protein